MFVCMCLYLSVSAGGVVLGLAGREMLANFIGGITIYISQPFSVGDWIHCHDRKELDGWVESIGWYYTKVYADLSIYIYIYIYVSVYIYIYVYIDIYIYR